MGNLLCKFRPPPRRRPLPGHRRPLVTPACAAAHPVRLHPAVPAPSRCPGRRPFHRDRRTLPASFHVEPKRRYPIPQAVCSPVGLLPLVNWRDPPKKPVLSARTSMMFGPSRTVRIPPPGHKFTVLRSLPEQTVKAVKPKPSSYLPASCPKGLGEKVQEVPREGKEDFVETRGQDDGNRAPHSSGDILLTSRLLETDGLLSSHQCSPAPVDQSPNPSGDSLGENTQICLVSSPSERPVVTSEGPAGDGVPLQKPDTDAAVLSNPTPSCPLLQERLTQEVVAENHQPIQSIPDLSRKDKDREGDKPSGIPSEYSFPPVSATSRPSKRKISMPLFMPLPPPMPLQWGRGELPPPPKLPCIAIDKNLGILENTESQRKKIFEGGAEILADSQATQPASSPPLLASKTTDSLPPAIHTLQVPVPTTDLADQSARPPIPSVPPPSPTENNDQERGYVAPNSPTLSVPTGSLPPLSSSPTGEIPLKNKDPLHPVISITSISDPLTPLNTSTISLQVPSCKGESPTPMCVDPTPLPVPSPNSPVYVVQVVAPQAGPSAITAKASANLTSDHTSNSDVIDMDTTPPSHAIIFRSPPGPGVSSPSLSQGHCSRMPKRPGKTLGSTIPSKSMATYPTPVLNQPFNPNITPQPTQGTLAGQQQTAFLPNAGISTGLLMNSGTTTVPVGSTSANCSHSSDPDAMDTTPPSQAVVFHSLPQSKANHSSFHNTPPSSSTAVAHNSTNLPAKSAITPTSIPNHSAPGITSQPVSGNQNGQQPGNSYLLGKPVAPTQAIGPTASIAQPSKDGIKKSGLAASAFGTTVKKQKAFAYKKGILPVGISTTAGCAVATGMPSAGVSSSLIILTPAQSVFTGPAAPMDGGSFGFGVSIPGTAHSQVPRTSKFRAGLQGAPSTTSAPLFGQITQAMSQNNTAAALGGASTVPVLGKASDSTLNPGTWGQPVQNVGGAVVGNYNTVSTVGGASVPTTHKCTQGSSKQRKTSPGRKLTTKDKRNGSRDKSTSTLNPSTKSQPAQSRGGTIMGKDNAVPTIGGCSVPVTFKCIQGSSKQRKPSGGRGTTSEKRNTSRDMCVSPLNLNTRGQPAQSMGSTAMGKDNTAPTIRSCSVPVTFKCIRGSSKQTKPGGRRATSEKRNTSRDMCVSPLNLKTRSQPAQSTGSTAMGKDNTVSTIGGCSVPVTFKCIRGSSKQRKPSGGRGTTSEKRNTSRDMCVSPLNLSTRGQPAQSMGSTAIGKDNTVPTIRDCSVPITFKCIRGSSEQRKPSGGRGTTSEKRNTSRDMCVSPLNLNTRGRPAQSTGSTAMGKDNTAPTIRGCSVPATFKCIQGSSKQTKPGGRRATSEKRNTSRDMCVSPLNLNTRGQPAQSTGSTAMGKDNNVATIRGCSVPITSKCIRGSSEQRKPSGGRGTTSEKRNTTGDMCVSPLNLSTRGQPPQSMGSTAMGKDNTLPTIRGCSVPITFKCIRGSSKQRKPSGGRGTTSEKRNTSRDMCVSPLNMSTRGQPAQSTGSTAVRKDNTAPTIGGSSVPTTQKCTQGSSKQKHPTLGGKATAKEKRNVSKNVCVYPLQNTGGSPGHTTSVAVPSTSTNSVLQPTTSYLFPPSTCGTPAQHTGGLKEGYNIIPKTGKSGIRALPQYNCGPPDANTGGTDGEDIVAMMAGLYISKPPQKTCRLPSTNTGGATGISTTSTMTVNTNSLSSTQTTRSAPNHSTDGAMGGSAMEF